MIIANMEKVEITRPEEQGTGEARGILLCSTPRQQRKYPWQDGCAGDIDKKRPEESKPVKTKNRGMQIET